MTVAELLDRIGETSPTHHAMVLALQAIVHANAPGADEAVKYGGLYYATTRPFGGIFTYAEHISLEFTRGVELDDPAGLLRGEGKHRRHLRFTTPDDIDAAVIGPYVAQAFGRA
ncbi:hypothetical protein WH87_14315 [Devosia epidermidihirudinis]|uniref:YdhG-like domain-containing protein n=1 Tax=Devosia epidermidihirudinis TaxID=1293439 RepID=A0A0F5Q6G1_9HYPH|nr:DUF1801 domain-containing protein [Devosia epidermidihirudinis]KKC36515.1 hypothetical protein WH87_14315 [Devosia epidermidihirudinis]